MKNIKTVIDSIKRSNLSPEDKAILVAILSEDKTDYTGFIIALAKIMGVASEVFEKFDIDIGELIDKIF